MKVIDMGSNVYFVRLVLTATLDCHIQLGLCLTCHVFSLETRYKRRLKQGFKDAKHVLSKLAGIFCNKRSLLMDSSAACSEVQNHPVSSNANPSVDYLGRNIRLWTLKRNSI